MPSSEPDLPTLAVTDLRVGLFVHLDLNWMAHPFATNRFKIGSQQQIDTIRSLGLTHVRYDPARSDALPPPPSQPTPALSAGSVPPQPAAAAPEAQATPAASAAPASPPLPARPGADAVAAAPSGAPPAAPNPVVSCERQYAESGRALKAAFEHIRSAPAQAAQASAQLVQGMLAQMAAQQECALRLLADSAGERSIQHALNVSVLSLLLGRALGLPDAALQALGVAALWHDSGKFELPHQVRWRDDGMSPNHLKLYQEHVQHSLAMGQRLGLEASALLAIAQHHELADGSGFPLGLTGDKIAPLSQVLALVNRYEGLCNPANPIKALTPHEALALIFATLKAQFEARTLSAFIRMMGVYPPGSVVQLNDERYALVLSVNATRPLRPKLRVYDPQSRSGQALGLDLQLQPQLQIVRSLRPDQLPRPALTQLSPRPRVCYYFERAVDALESPGGSA